MLTYGITSELRAVNHGLVDFEADAILEREDFLIPCKVGFMKLESEDEPVATHIFIKDGITKDGFHYYKETIEL